jgi:hypothetical protein
MTAGPITPGPRHHGALAGARTGMFGRGPSLTALVAVGALVLGVGVVPAHAASPRTAGEPAVVGASTAASAAAAPVPAHAVPQIRAAGAPSTVTGTDGRRHLVYELIVANGTRSSVRLDRLEVVDPARENVVATYSGDAIKAITVDAQTAQPTRTVAPENGALILLDVPLRRSARVPMRLEHRFVLSLSRPGTQPRRVTVTRARTLVDQRAAIRISPPLRGPNLGVLGCCAKPFGHRLAALDRNGSPVFPQRYAIDFMRLDDTINTYAGDPTRNESYFLFGSEVIAVAPGRVVATRDGVPENTPPGLPPNVALNDLAGNFVNQDMGGGRFALYGHLQPGSLRVKPGDQVVPGQVLGLVGNTGNSSAPHLHFQVMDAAGGPSNLLADGLPYVFDAFTLDSHVGLDQTPPTLTRIKTPPPTERTSQYPFTGDVLTFP